MTGDTKSMRHLIDQIQKVADGDSTVLIHGESGTEKELVAVAIHRNSARAEGPFAAINCAAIPGSLLESEPFDMQLKNCRLALFGVSLVTVPSGFEINSMGRKTSWPAIT